MGPVSTTRSGSGHEKGGVNMSAIVSVLKQMKVRDLAGLSGRVIGLGLFVGLVYTYCHVLVESCFRGIR